MEFTLDFLSIFCIGLFYISPILITFVLVIFLIGQFIGYKEGWPTSDAFYFSFITATTVGYGEIHPKQTVSQYLSIVIAIIGLILAGVVVAVAIHSVTYAFEQTHQEKELIERLVG